MKSINDISIEEFPKDDCLWRVDWFGLLKPNDERSNSHKIEITISKIGNKSFPQKPKYASKKLISYYIDLSARERKQISISVGELAAVTVGSIWWNGRFIDDPVMEIFEPDIPGLDFNNMKAIYTGWEDKEKNIRCIPYQEYQIGESGMKSPALGIHYSGQKYKIIISMFELIRFYYGQSSAMLVKLFKKPFGDLLPTLFDEELKKKGSSLFIMVLLLMNWRGLFI